jgi:hypothetical protein
MMVRTQRCKHGNEPCEPSSYICRTLVTNESVNM